MHQDTDTFRFAIITISDGMGGGGSGFFDRLIAWKLRPEIVITDDPYCFPKASLADRARAVKQRARRVLKRAAFREKYYTWFRARELGIPTFPAQLVNSEACAARLRELDLDYTFIFTFHTILKEPVFSVPKHGTINFHPSILPEHRGATPCFWSIKDGEDYAGYTFHYLDAGIDTGQIIRRYRVPLTGCEDSATLLQHLHTMASREYVRLIARLKLGQRIEPDRTNGIADSFEMGVRGPDLYIDTSMLGDEVLRLVSASSRYGGAVIVHGGKKFRVLDAIALDSPPAGVRVNGQPHMDESKNVYFRAADESLIYLVTQT